MQFDVFDTILFTAYMVLFGLLSVSIATGLIFDRIPKLLAKFMGISGAFVAGLSIYFGVHMVHADYSAYLAESECVASFVSSGIERSDIVTANGSCYVE